MSDPQLGQLATVGRSTTVNMRALTPFQRALLVTDGTVTKFIEAYTLEPLVIVRLPETNAVTPELHAWLEVESSDAVTQREVIIQGKYSQTLYVYAVSLVVPERLPPAVRRRLEDQGEGLGRLLNEAKVETRREVLWYAREHADSLPAAVRSRTDGEFVTRVYRIIARRRPVALIIERFPSVLGNLPAPE